MPIDIQGLSCDNSSVQTINAGAPPPHISASGSISAKSNSYICPLRQNAFFYSVAALLLFTAIAKLWMLLTDPFAEVRVGLPKSILWAAVIGELGLAYVNIFNRERDWVAFVDLTAFSCFAVFAATRLILGYHSCGCSGWIEIPGWVFLSIDVFIVSWLVLSKKNRVMVRTGAVALFHAWRDSPIGNRGRISGIGFSVCVFLFAQLSNFGPFQLFNDRATPVRAIVSIEDSLRVGETATVSVELVNESEYPAEIIGLSKSCKCFEMVESCIGKIVPAGGRLSFLFGLRPEKAGLLRQRAVLFVDHSGQFRVNVDFFTNVIGEE